MSKTQEGYLLIADITGYTVYLSKSELEHAQEILTVLLELLVDHTRPPLVLSRLAGDAVISYGLADHFYQGQTFIEMIEDTYVAFRKAIEKMVLNNNCHCNACANISGLDLKFFIHYGVFIIQHIGDHDELVGSDVNLIHRLLKNHVSEKTGFRAYSLYTDAAIRHLGSPDIHETMTSHAEKYEYLDEVNVWIQDMHPIWEQKRVAGRVTFLPDQVLIQFEVDIQAQPEQVWDYLSIPEYVNILTGADRQEITDRSHGRITTGSVFHCYHGDHASRELILEWQPFERMVTQSLVPVPVPNTLLLCEYRLTPTETGTCLAKLFSKATGPLPGRIMSNLVMPLVAKQGLKDLVAFKQRVEADLVARAVGTVGGVKIDITEISLAVETSLQFTKR